MKNKHVIYTWLVILLMINIVSASLIDDLRDRFIPRPQRSEPISVPANELEGFTRVVLSLNTPANIGMLDAEMDRYGTKAVKVRVYGFNPDSHYIGTDFYIVKGAGFVRKYPTNDKEIVLEKPQAYRAVEILTDGQITLWERIELYSLIERR